MAEHHQRAAGREGSLAAPTRHPVAWREPDFWNEESLFKELERVYDLCHGCRRCFSLCNSFPLLFDAIDASPTASSTAWTARSTGRWWTTATSATCAT